MTAPFYLSPIPEGQDVKCTMCAERADHYDDDSLPYCPDPTHNSVTAHPSLNPRIQGTMASNIETFTSVLVDAFTDGGYGTGWEDLAGIDVILKEATSPDDFVSLLRGEPSRQWVTWADTLKVTAPSADEVEAILTEVGDIIAPYVELPVTTIVGHSVKRENTARRFVDGAPPRSKVAVGKRQPIERDADQKAFIDALLRDGFRFDMTYAEWVSADRNVIGRMSWNDEAVWLSQPLPSTERLRYTERKNKI